MGARFICESSHLQSFPVLDKPDKWILMGAAVNDLPAVRVRLKDLPESSTSYDKRLV